MANTVANDDRWMSQSGTAYPDNAENKRIGKADSLSTYAPSDGGQSENGRITHEAEVETPEDPESQE